MRAVWSFWSKPFRDGTAWAWYQPLHHLLAWGLSLRVARRHYPETMLITDSPGKALLVDDLGLSFTHVSTELDRLRDEDPALWSLGKLVAYSLQEEPFVHLDADVFLWRPLPDRLITAQVLAQHPEYWSDEGRQWRPRTIENAFAQDGLTLPAEWEWARSHWGHAMHLANCGIVGGTNLDFIRYYARLALDLVMNPRCSAVWERIPSKEGLAPIIEQFTLSACLEFHRSHPESPFRGVHFTYLFPSSEAAFDSTNATRLGFTHLMGDTKSNERIARRLEDRMDRDDRPFYRRCLALSRVGVAA